LDSDEYRYAYFYSDALLTLALYVALINLYAHVFGELRFSRYLRLTAVLLLLGTAVFSYAVVAQSSDLLCTAFAFELSQNLYFVGLVLTYVLWGAVLKLRETRTRLVQFVLSLGLYFSAYAASYALGNLASKYSVLLFLGPALGCFLPLSWTITMWRHSDEARLVPAQLVAVPR
jgi:predicted neutral ceramidase superfamily lipid hydrolase